MYVVAVFVPPSHTEAVLAAVFAAGAGCVGAYDRCAFTVRGEGRFRPLAGASPFLGRPGADERTPEDRVEFVAEDGLVDGVLTALRSAHPYQEPAIHLVRLDERCIPADRLPSGV